MIRLAPEEFELWSEYIYELTGIVLTPNKCYLIENRLADLVRERGCASFKELLFKCRYNSDIKTAEDIINRISTQETSFFRDAIVYQALGDLVKNEILPARRIAAAGQRPRLRIWSAACSHGQEPYSIAMVLSESLPDITSWDVEIMATDIAENAFEKARAGQYSELEVKRGLDSYHLNKYFRQLDGNQWRVKDSLRNLVKFQRLNLVTGSFSLFGPFNLVFCRNVAIYFDHETKIKLFEKVSKVLDTEGRLFIGATENLSQVTQEFVPVYRYGAVFYVKAGSPLARETSSPVFTPLAGASRDSATKGNSPLTNGKPSNLPQAYPPWKIN